MGERRHLLEGLAGPTLALEAVNRATHEFTGRQARRAGLHPTDLWALRLLDVHDSLGPTELARRLDLRPASTTALIDRLEAINAGVSQMVARHDASGYIRMNLEFHRTLYLRAQSPAILAMTETVWLQLGPTMRTLYGRLRRTDPPYHHKLILAALRAGDEPGLRLAVRTDVTQGLRLLKG